MLVVVLPFCFVAFPIFITLLFAITTLIEKFSLRGFKGVALMLCSFIPYYLFLPTMIAWCAGAYAIARFADLKWGNRADSTESSAEVIATGQTLLAFAVTLNLLVAAICIYNGSHLQFVLVALIVVLFSSVFEMTVSLIFFSIHLITIPYRWAMNSYMGNQLALSGTEYAPDTPFLQDDRGSDSARDGSFSTISISSD
jgi:hypothetical protein